MNNLLGEIIHLKTVVVCGLAGTMRDEKKERAKVHFRHALCRELSPDEQKYLSLSSMAVPINDLELIELQKEQIRTNLVEIRRRAEGASPVPGNVENQPVITRDTNHAESQAQNNKES